MRMRTKEIVKEEADVVVEVVDEAVVMLVVEVGVGDGRLRHRCEC